jgi:predicted ATP-grasp superfamily ATP-dependent carboligase
MENPVAALAILRVFARLAEVDVDTGELAQQAHETVEQVKQAMAVAMGEYLEHFTEPIWESDGEQEDESDEDEHIEN